MPCQLTCGADQRRNSSAGSNCFPAVAVLEGIYSRLGRPGISRCAFGIDRFSLQAARFGLIGGIWPICPEPLGQLRTSW
jgi:hypothetical protein